MRRTERVPVVVIGGGQAGLTAGYYLQKAGIPFVILDGGARVGDAWRQRWDSLRLFSPSFYDGLPGMRFPGPALTWPTKDQMADYLENYARRLALPVRLKTRVTHLRRQGDEFLLETSAGDIQAEQVVVAMSSYQRPKVPAFARELDSRIVQLHSSSYRNPGQLRPGPVLVVGAGNSGADIAMDLVRTRPTVLAGPDVGAIPFRIETLAARYFFVHLIRFLGHHILNIGTPVGRKARVKMLHRATPLVRVKPGDLIAAGIERVSRVTGVLNGQPVLDNGRVLEVANVVWCTGFEHDHGWIDLPIFDQQGDPRHEAGIVDTQPGLYFLGLHFLYSATSATLNGIGRDARRIVSAIRHRHASFASPRRPAPREAVALTA